MLKKSRSSKYAKLDEAIEDENSDFIASEDAKQAQIMRRQDDELEALGQSVKVLGNMGREMGNELEKQNRMLEDLETDVDKTDSRVKSHTRRVEELIKKNKNKCLNTTIVILVIVLVVLLIFIFVV